MDAQELEETYRRYFPVIRAKCNRMLRDSTEAQDLAQETFSRLWARRTDLRDPEAALAWIYRTATRLAVDRIRRDHAAANVELAQPNDEPNPVGQLEARQELLQVLRRLGTRELEVLMLARVDGLTQEDIGTVMRMSDRSVRRLLKKADASVQKVTRESR